MISTNTQHPPVKAVGLISGGLDSILAAKIVKNLGVEVHGVYFAMPWGCCDKQAAQNAADQIGIKLIVLQLDERYLEIVKNPKHGYGTALNPCVDCRIHMFTRAGQYMRHIGADFCFTGEVVGQRPMSQKKVKMKTIEHLTGLEGRLLRPLSAGLLEPTIVEQQGLIDREKLLQLSGRSRKPQYKLADELAITQFSAPAGGCALTSPEFAVKMKDTLEFGYRTFRETISLKWGRHFRINESSKIILGKNSQENDNLIQFAHPEDFIMMLPTENGPTAIVKTNQSNPEILGTCAGLIQYHSRYKAEAAKEMVYYQKKSPQETRKIFAEPISETLYHQYRL